MNVNLTEIPDRPLQAHERQALRNHLTETRGDVSADIPDDQLDDRMRWGTRWERIDTTARCDFTNLITNPFNDDERATYWHLCSRRAQFVLRRPLGYYEPREGWDEPENHSRGNGHSFDLKQFDTVVLSCREHAGKRTDE